MINDFFTYGLPVIVAVISGLTFIYVVKERQARKSKEAFNFARQLLEELDKEFSVTIDKGHAWYQIEPKKLEGELARISKSLQELSEYINEIKCRKLVNNHQLDKAETAKNLRNTVYTMGSCPNNHFPYALNASSKKQFRLLIKFIYAPSIKEACDERFEFSKADDEANIRELIGGLNEPMKSGLESLLREIIFEEKGAK